MLNLPPYTYTDAYIRIRVDAGIFPTNALVHVGSRVCFKSILDGPSSGPGSGIDAQWTSSNPSMVVFDKRVTVGSVIGTVMVAGETIVSYHQQQTGFFTHTTLRSSPAAFVGFDMIIYSATPVPLPEPLIGGRVRHVPLAFAAADQEMFTPLEQCRKDSDGTRRPFQQQQVFFLCTLQTQSLRDSFTVTPVFDEFTGYSACEVVPVTDRPTLFIPTTSVVLLVTVLDANQLPQEKYTYAFPFIAIFTVSKTDFVFTEVSQRYPLVIHAGTNSQIEFFYNGKVCEPTVVSGRQTEWAFGTVRINDVTTPATMTSPDDDLSKRTACRKGCSYIISIVNSEDQMINFNVMDTVTKHVQHLHIAVQLSRDNSNSNSNPNPKTQDKPNPNPYPIDIADPSEAKTQDNCNAGIDCPILGPDVKPPPKRQAFFLIDMSWFMALSIFNQSICVIIVGLAVVLIVFFYKHKRLPPQTPVLSAIAIPRYPVAPPQTTTPANARPYGGNRTRPEGFVRTPDQTIDRLRSPYTGRPALSRMNPTSLQAVPGIRQ